ASRFTSHGRLSIKPDRSRATTPDISCVRDKSRRHACKIEANNGTITRFGPKFLQMRAHLLDEPCRVSIFNRRAMFRASEPCIRGRWRRVPPAARKSGSLSVRSYTAPRHHANTELFGPALYRVVKLPAPGYFPVPA